MRQGRRLGARAISNERFPEKGLVDVLKRKKTPGVPKLWSRISNLKKLGKRVKMMEMGNSSDET